MAVKEAAFNNFKSVSAATQPSKSVETQKSAIESKNEETNSHKVRNWSIGLGAAATLISLGVLGRGGHLGEGVQKFLRGTAKDVHLKPNVHLEEDVLIGAGSRVEEAAVTVEEHIAGETVGRAEQTTTQAPAVSVKPAKPTITAEEATKINAELDRTIPVLGDDIPEFIQPRTVDEFLRDIHIEEDISKYKLGTYYYTEQRFPNGEYVHVLRDSFHDLMMIERFGEDNKVIYTVKYKKAPKGGFPSYPEKPEDITEELLERMRNFDPKNIEFESYIDEIDFCGVHYFYEPDGKLKNIVKSTKDVWYYYTPEGKLRLASYFKNFGGGSQTSRRVYFEEGTKNPKLIKYNDRNFQDVKTEVIEDKKVVKEIFYKDRQEIEI